MAQEKSDSCNDILCIVLFESERKEVHGSCAIRAPFSVTDLMVRLAVNMGKASIRSDVEIGFSIYIYLRVKRKLSI